MADNRYGRDDDWRGRQDRDRMDRERGGMMGGRDEDNRNFTGFEPSRSTYFE